MKRRRMIQLRSCRRQGFSLFELMVVLAIMLLLAGLAAPQFMENVRVGRVIDAAEDARSVVASARLFAIEFGVDYHVRYEVGGNAVVAIPAERNPELSNNVSPDPKDRQVKLMEATVDPELKFNALDGESVGGESLEAADFLSLENSGDLAQRSWSSPITFRPDGSASDATFRVMDEEGRQSEISIRGLTGAVRVSQVYLKDDQ